MLNMYSVLVHRLMRLPIFSLLFVALHFGRRLVSSCNWGGHYGDRLTLSAHPRAEHSALIATTLMDNAWPILGGGVLFSTKTTN